MSKKDRLMVIVILINLTLIIFMGIVIFKYFHFENQSSSDTSLDNSKEKEKFSITQTVYWGMKYEEFKELKSKEITGGGKVNDHYSKYKCNEHTDKLIETYYDFFDNELISYTIQYNNYKNLIEETYINNYNTIKDSISQNYGNPSIEDELDKPHNLYAIWETDDTIIKLTLWLKDNPALFEEHISKSAIADGKAVY